MDAEQEFFYINKLKQLAELSLYDAEKAHKNADTLLLALITELGYAEIANEFLKIQKWYS